MNFPRQFVLCLHCAEVLPPGQVPAVCPECRSPTDPINASHLLYFGRNAFKYGYQYRGCYEAEYRETRKVASRCQLLSFSEFMTFAAIAAASGIVGNAAYDLIKAVLRKLWRQARQSREPRELLYAELFESDAGLRRFIDCIRDYTQGFARLRNRQVKGAIEDEILVDVRINRRNETLNAANDGTTPLLEVDPAKQPAHLLAPTADQFVGLWSAVDPEKEPSAPAARKARKPRRKKRKPARSAKSANDGNLPPPCCSTWTTFADST